MEDYHIDELDNKILRLISNNARISFLEVARVCSVSGAAVHQRIQRLIANNIITGSEFTLNVTRIGYETCAYVNLYFDPKADIETSVERMRDIPEIVECHFTTGPYDLLVKIYARNNNHLHEIIQAKLRPLGVDRSESIISYRESFRRQITLASDTPEEPISAAAILESEV